jgi:hypothetical protein
MSEQENLRKNAFIGARQKKSAKEEEKNAARAQNGKCNSVLYHSIFIFCISITYKAYQCIHLLPVI